MVVEEEQQVPPQCENDQLLIGNRRNNSNKNVRVQSSSNKPSSTSSSTRNLILKQLWVASGICGCVVCSASVAGNSATLLPSLEAEMDINQEQASWIASIMLLSIIPGTFANGWTMNKFGRRSSNLLSLVVLAFSWALLYFADSIELVLLARLIGGLGIGLSSTSTTAYLAEVAHPLYRSLMLSTISLSLTIGLFFVHIIGTYFHWRTLCLIMLAPCLITGLLVYAAPETHVWYLMRNDIDRAKKAYNKYRDIETFNAVELATTTTQRRLTFNELKQEVARSEFLMPLFISGLYFVTMQFSGTNVVVFYAVGIMQITIENVDRYTAMLIADAIRLLSSIIASILTKYVRVRVLTTISCLGSALSLFSLAACIQLSAVHKSEIVRTMPLILLTTYIFFVSIGLIPLAWTLCGELLPHKIRGIGTSINTAINFISFFIIVKTGPMLFDTLGTSLTFTLYGCCITLGFAILWFVLPETKNKSLQDIQAIFSRK